MTDTEKVNEYLKKLEHPLKSEIEAVRKIIIESNEKLSERIKWAAPSFYFKEDLVTFNHRNQKVVQLVFHHPKIVEIQSPFLEGVYKDRRLMHFKNMEEVLARKSELQKIMNDLVNFIDKKIS